MKRKIFAMFLALVMVFSMAVGAYAAESETDGTPALVLDVKKGEASATVAVHVQGCDGVTNGSFSVEYDASVFTLAETQTTNAYAMNSINTETAGTVSFAWVGSELTAEKTLMLTLVLEAKGSIDESVSFSVSSDGIFAGTDEAEVSGDSVSVEPGEEVDTSALEQAIAIAESENKDAYTYESYSAMEKALAKAIAVLANSESTQAEIDEAAATLYAAISQLVPSGKANAEVITPELPKRPKTPEPATILTLFLLLL